MARRTSKAWSAIFWIAIALVGIAALAAILKLTDKETGEFKTFYVTYGDQTIVSSDSELTFETGETPSFGVHYTFDVLSGNTLDYNVAIIANGDANFEFTVDGVTKVWRAEKDLADFFSLQKEASGFTLTIPEDIRLQTILETLYPGQDVEAPAADELDAPYLYTIVVSSYNEKVQYNIHFALLNAELRVRLDQTNYTF